MEVKYKRGSKDDFYQTVNKLVNVYFESNKLSRKTNAFGLFKAIFLCFIYGGLYFLVLTSNGNNTLLLLSFALMGFIQICIVLNLGHEGVHGSFSNNKKINHILSYSFDLIGSSGYLWKMRHVYSHHHYPMIPEHDVDIQQTGLLSFLPLEKPNKAFRFQKIYVPFLYCGYTLNAVFKRDWEDFFSEKIGMKTVKHSRAAYASFIISKLIYFSYSLILPLLFSGGSWPMVILGFVLMHVAASLSAAVALFPAHLYEESVFPSPDGLGQLNDKWAEHQMRVTMDFGTRLPFVAFFFGGINYHAVHHLFPTVAHVHFPAIQKILKKTADEFNISYRHRPSLNDALYSHWRLLKKNGVPQLNEIV